MFCCGHTKTITVQLLCYIQELSACIVFQKLCSPFCKLYVIGQVRPFCNFQVQINSPVLQARTIPGPIVELLKWTLQMSRSITIFYNCSEYLWFIDRLILRRPFGKNDAIRFCFLMFKKLSYPAISCLVKRNSVLRSILSLISSALHFPNVFYICSSGI